MPWDGVVEHRGSQNQCIGPSAGKGEELGDICGIVLSVSIYLHYVGRAPLRRESVGSAQGGSPAKIMRMTNHLDPRMSLLQQFDFSPSRRTTSIIDDDAGQAQPSNRVDNTPDALPMVIDRNS
jgi:hypothetical protein